MTEKQSAPPSPEALLAAADRLDAVTFQPHDGARLLDIRMVTAALRDLLTAPSSRTRHHSQEE